MASSDADLQDTSEKGRLVQVNSADVDLSFRDLVALDAWYADVAAGSADIFPNDVARETFFRKLRASWRRRWTRSHQCMFRGCTAPSIRRSHAIPRGGPLAAIAEGGHVLGPRFRDGQGLEFRPIGIREASTFPGFCGDHEGVFEEFERSRSLGAPNDWLLQFFRTVCWELRILEHARQRLANMAAAYEQAICEHGTRTLSRVVCGPLRIRGAKRLDWRQVAMQTELERIDDMIAGCERDFAVPLREQLEGHDASVQVFVLETREVFPVCLAGRGNYHCDGAAGVTRVDAFLQVVPAATGTKLAMLGAAHLDWKLIPGYVRMFLEDHGLVRLIEAWMMNGTDHWFLRPSVWGALSLAQRDRILAEHRDTGRSIGEPADETIFGAPWDRLREQRGHAEVRFSVVARRCPQTTVAG